MLVLSISASKKLDQHNKIEPLQLSFRNFLAISPLKNEQQNITFNEIRSASIFKCCGILENAHAKLQSDCKPFLSSDLEEEWFQMGPWAVTSLWVNQAGDISCCSPPASPNRERCKKMCFELQLGRMALPEGSGRKHQGTLKVDFLDFGLRHTEDLKSSLLQLKMRHWQLMKLSEPFQRWWVLKHSSDWHPGCSCWIGCSGGGSLLHIMQ